MSTRITKKERLSLSSKYIVFFFFLGGREVGEGRVGREGVGEKNQSTGARTSNGTELKYNAKYTEKVSHPQNLKTCLH